MHDNLSSYDKYLSDGLITKDQYNYQHSLYFQQQSTYQSLVSQKMQLESQVTQLNSDKITKQLILTIKSRHKKTRLMIIKINWLNQTQTVTLLLKQRLKAVLNH